MRAKLNFAIGHSIASRVVIARHGLNYDIHSVAHHSFQPLRFRLFTTCPRLWAKQAPLPPKPVLPDGEIKHVYLKGSGPGGQKINKTSSAVQLTHLPTGIVVKSQATRSRSQNHTIARRLLAERVEELDKGDGARHLIKRAIKAKRKASGEKKRRRKYKKLEEVKEGRTADLESEHAEAAAESEKDRV